MTRGMHAGTGRCGSRQPIEVTDERRKLVGTRHSDTGARSSIGLAIGFAVTNKSSVAAMGVCVKLTAEDVDRVLFPEYLPWRPQARLGPTYAPEHLVTHH